MAATIKTGIRVCIHNTAVTTIIVAVWIVGLIVAETIANQCNISTARNLERNNICIYLQDRKLNGIVQGDVDIFLLHTQFH